MSKSFKILCCTRQVLLWSDNYYHGWWRRRKNRRGCKAYSSCGGQEYVAFTIQKCYRTRVFFGLLAHEICGRWMKNGAPRFGLICVVALWDWRAGPNVSVQFSFVFSIRAPRQERGRFWRPSLCLFSPFPSSLFPVEPRRRFATPPLRAPPRRGVSVSRRFKRCGDTWVRRTFPWVFHRSRPHCPPLDLAACLIEEVVGEARERHRKARPTGEGGWSGSTPARGTAPSYAARSPRSSCSATPTSSASTRFVCPSITPCSPIHSPACPPLPHLPPAACRLPSFAPQIPHPPPLPVRSPQSPTRCVRTADAACARARGGGEEPTHHLSRPRRAYVFHLAA